MTVLDTTKLDFDDRTVGIDERVGKVFREDNGELYVLGFFPEAVVNKESNDLKRVFYCAFSLRTGNRWSNPSFDPNQTLQGLEQQGDKHSVALHVHKLEQKLLRAVQLNREVAAELVRRTENA